MKNIFVKEILSEKQMLDEYPLLKQLNSNLTKPELKEMLKDMIAYGYRMVGCMMVQFVLV